MRPRSPLAPTVLALTFALTLAAAAVAAPQGDRHPRLDASEKVAFSGKVVEIVSEPGAGSTLVLDSGKERQLIHLGPPEVLERLGLKLVAGDAVSGEAFGGACRGDGLAARMVEKTASHEKVTLRDETGVPTWRGEGNGRGAGCGRGGRHGQGGGGGQTCHRGCGHGAGHGRACGHGDGAGRGPGHGPGHGPHAGCPRT